MSRRARQRTRTLSGEPGGAGPPCDGDKLPPYLGHVERRGVAVVQPHALEVHGGDLRVLPHVGPEVRAVLRLLPVAQLHAVAPADQLPPEIHVGAWKERAGLR